MTDLNELSTEELKRMLQECETKISLADKSQHSTLLCPYCREVVHFAAFAHHCETIHGINIPRVITPRYLEERYSMLGGITWVS